MNHLWARLLMEELVRSGVRCCFVAPGSRSTPFTTAAAQHPKMKTVVHFDERGTAFAALGYGRATRRPAAWITTSGTAVANGFPAVVEAATDNVPMLLLTADRPPELRATGANQTIDQVKLFGDYVRWQADLPAPSEEVAPEALLTTVDQAVYRALSAPAGPVHLNAMFRKPLAPVSGPMPPEQYFEEIGAWLEGEAPYTRYEASPALPEPSVLKEAQQLLGQMERVLVVAGRMATLEEAESVLELARRRLWPVLPDAASQLRLGCSDEGDVRILSYDHLLASSAACKELAPQAVLHVGAVPMSKRLNQALRRWKPEVYLHLHPSPERFDPNHQVSHRLQGSIGPVCVAWREALSSSKSDGYLSAWQRRDVSARKKLDAFFDSARGLSEPLVARLVTEHLPEGTALVASSSMPIREVDMFGSGNGQTSPVVANRGTSGIDGLVATAAGYVHGSGQPTVLLTGDLALLHDLNSLALLREVPVVVVVLNNDGGGIFSFLPIAEHAEVFEPFFGTPHGLSFEAAAQQFQLGYVQAGTRAEFEEAFAKAASGKKSTIVEVVTNRQENRALHKRLLEVVQEVL